jgi:hypothetical protein
VQCESACETGVNYSGYGSHNDDESGQFGSSAFQHHLKSIG